MVPIATKCGNETEYEKKEKIIMLILENTWLLELLCGILVSWFVWDCLVIYDTSDLLTKICPKIKTLKLGRGL